MLFPNQIFAFASKLVYSIHIFRNLLKKMRPEKQEAGLPEYLSYPNLAPLAKNFQDEETPAQRKSQE